MEPDRRGDHEEGNAGETGKGKSNELEKLQKIQRPNMMQVNRSYYGYLVYLGTDFFLFAISRLVGLGIHHSNLPRDIPCLPGFPSPNSTFSSGPFFFPNLSDASP